ncbi:uncharacterized protein CLUP02_13596 [Colletotrichum lupini]|uniref:At2g23090-like zinc-binding domain-containing protein n=1 Tax=Colletotrichum lupini TaxID=145971 RepID=A0A9Q8WLT8_9PEZI|nr:uncharacterized protein CLUP02_13596 [Colletotrichum lupini]UQC88074.1 hypothetical protein CLUP02_13596 [Colletotrichum lupini]
MGNVCTPNGPFPLTPPLIRGAKAQQKRDRNAKDAKPKGSQLKVNAAAKDIQCQICKSTFLKTTKAPALTEHAENKHSKGLADCFPAFNGVVRSFQGRAWRHGVMLKKWRADSVKIWPGACSEKASFEILPSSFSENQEKNTIKRVQTYAFTTWGTHRVRAGFSTGTTDEFIQIWVC